MVNPFINLINQYLPVPESTLLAGMLFGGSSAFSRELYNNFIVTGTIHVVALSGTNIAILINMISKTSYLVGRKLGSLLSILLILGFIWFVGPSPTIIRAGIMASLSMIAVYFGRPKLSLLSLLLAGLFMVLYDLKIVENISFQLSFLASLGIIIFASDISANNPKKASSFWGEIFNGIIGVFKENFRTTLAAQVMTLPVIVFTFGRLSLVSPLANVLVGWTVTPIMVLGLMVCIVGAVYFPLGQILAWLVYPLLYYFIKVVEVCAEVPYGQIILR